MTLSFGFILIISVPFILFGGTFGAPSKRVRRTVLAVCTVLSAIAGILWLAGLGTLLLVVLTYVPAYQVELYAFVTNEFRSSHGREMHLMASGIVADPELKKDARYSTAYFTGALGVPLLMLVIFAT